MTDDPVHRYHDGTKHHFHRFARSLGYLDWASQPHPFRSFSGAPARALSPRPDAPASALGDVLRHALGLSAWKQYGSSRWSLRVNPSSGNLHPTEAYIVCGPQAWAGDEAAVFHYAPDRHELERRCAIDPRGWDAALHGGEPAILVALTSIHWREAWKYGERAFRYCQHDLGHAMAAVRIAAALAGWQASLLPDWSSAEVAALTGIDRDEDFVDAEREEPGCVLALGRSLRIDKDALLACVRAGLWTGRASRLSEDHVDWTFIDEIAGATRAPARQFPGSPDHQIPKSPNPQITKSVYPRSLLRQRRSALGFDGRSSIGAEPFLSMLSRTMPSPAPSGDVLWWNARVHLAVFVHRVDGIEPGLYLLARRADAAQRLREACRREFSWAPVSDRLPLFELARCDCRRLVQRLSCDQDIASDGFFSLGMLADFDASLQEFGPSFYRCLFWESGSIGQTLYLEAEAAGARGTGIGCFYDDPVHDVLGLEGHAFQSLYHFTVGMPVEDTRLTTEPGYPWEA